MIDRIKVIKIIHIEYKLNGRTGIRIVRCADRLDSKAAYIKAWDAMKWKHKKLELIFLNFATVTKNQFKELKQTENANKSNS